MSGSIRERDARDAEAGDDLKWTREMDDRRNLLAALDALVEAGEWMFDPIAHVEHRHPQFPLSECDECGMVWKKRRDNLRAAIARAKEVTG